MQRVVGSNTTFNSCQKNSSCSCLLMSVPSCSVHDWTNDTPKLPLADTLARNARFAIPPC